MNTWALVLTTWMLINGQPANVAIEPIAYYKTQQGCETAKKNLFIKKSDIQSKLECVYNGSTI